MGYEYTCNVNQEDIERLSKNPGKIKNLQDLVNETIAYSETITDKDSWLPSLAVTEQGLYICIYNRDPESMDMKLLHHVLNLLLDHCGRAEICEL